MAFRMTIFLFVGHDSDLNQTVLHNSKYHFTIFGFSTQSEFGNAQARFPTVGTLRRTFFSFVFVATLHSFYLGYLVKAFK